MTFFATIDEKRSRTAEQEEGFPMALAENNAQLRVCVSEVQRVFGGCLLRLQGYELLLKTILSQHQFSVQAAGAGAAQIERSTDMDRKTLGNLIAHFLDSFLITQGEQGQPLSPIDAHVASYQMQVAVSDDDYALIESDLRELVMLRNDLVHHFLERHSLNSVAGCEGALADLAETSTKIAQAASSLRAWAEDVETAKRGMLEFLASPETQHFVREGRFPWSITAIVQALQQAETELSVNGWTHVASATMWISERYPEELPEGYGCSSWRQVIHDSALFELSYRQMDGPRQAWFRSRASAPNTR